MENLLSKYWAKSDGTTIREHTDKLLENLKHLRNLYGEKIEKVVPESFRKEFWKALELACEYHDYGKLHKHFQKKAGNKSVKPDKGLPEVRHNLLSPAFIPEDIPKPLKDLVILAVLNHHEYVPDEQDIEKVREVLEKEFGKELKYKKLLKNEEYNYLGELSKRFPYVEKTYILLKGFLLRIDHASSNKYFPKVETEKLSENEKRVEKYLKERKNNQLNGLQRFVLENREDNLLITASTGYGKTEAGFIFLKEKGFFTLPIRTAVNAIYERAKEVFSEEEAGLLHSTAILYRIGDEVERNSFEGIVKDYHLSRNFGKPLLVSTPDQFMPFIFRPAGFEKYLATLSYSRVVIDEIQLFEPHTLGFIVEAVKKITEFGGKIMVSTATLPTFVRKDLINLNFKEKVFLKREERHNVKVLKDSLINAVEFIKKLSREGKVLVITNTVKRAVELGRLLGGNILHARFTYRDRRKKEKEIEEFFKAEGKGIWITTQIAEASLDLDADYLITELSSVDSLIQRMGRVNRQGKKSIDKPNVYIYTRDISGVGSVYKKSLLEITEKNLKEGIWDEEFKYSLTERVYEEVFRLDEEYRKHYEKAKSYIKDLWSLKKRFNKNEAQRMFRDIFSITVIPEVFREEVEPLIEKDREEKDLMNRYIYLKEILDYTLDVLPYRGSFEPVWGLKGIYWAKGTYSGSEGFTPTEEEGGNII
ncbi:CRISPR-associated helicase/endonuclease Cas3 [Aquifex pyrophilus]